MKNLEPVEILKAHKNETLSDVINKAVAEGIGLPSISDSKKAMDNGAIQEQDIDKYIEAIRNAEQILRTHADQLHRFQKGRRREN